MRTTLAAYLNKLRQQSMRKEMEEVNWMKECGCLNMEQKFRWKEKGFQHYKERNKKSVVGKGF